MDEEFAKACIEFGRKQERERIEFLASVKDGIAPIKLPATPIKTYRSKADVLSDFPEAAPKRGGRPKKVLIEECQDIAPSIAAANGETGNGSEKERKPRQTGVSNAVLSALNDGGDWSIVALQGKTRCEPSAIRQALNGLKKKGLADSDGRGKWFGRASVAA